MLTFMRVAMMTTMPAIGLSPNLLVLNWGETWAITSYRSGTMLTLTRDFRADFTISLSL